jgi:ABC-type transport system substrate-binding protein
MPWIPGKKSWPPLVAGIVLTLTLAGCARHVRPPAVTFRWWMGCAAPGFDPDGPPDPTRAALERLLTRQLVEQDSLGRPQLSAASRLTISNDRLHYTFALRSDLRFTDGSPCRSSAFLAALETGLNRGDHSTRLWLLRAVRGTDLVRAGRPLPRLGIRAPDDTTLAIDLARPDSLLLEKLAVPGGSAAWSSRAPDPSWSSAVGLGPYRVLRSSPGGIVLSGVGEQRPDTIAVRFGLGAPRALAQLRAGAVDLMWPLPPGLEDETLAPGYHRATGEAVPPRWLALVMRADVPPTTRLAARRALAHGIPRAELPRRVGAGARDVRAWLPGGGTPDLPSLDQSEIERWLDRGKLGRSFHALMAYDADGAGAAVARSLQGDWARYGLYLDLRPLRDPEWSRQALSGQAQVLLVEYQGLTPDPPGVLAPLVMPLRGPAVGAFRTGWRTREFDRWLWPVSASASLAPAYVERRLEEETVVLPLCQLGWTWLARQGGPPVAFRPAFGPSGAEPGWKWIVPR